MKKKNSAISIVVSVMALHLNFRFFPFPFIYCEQGKFNVNNVQK